MPMIGIVASKAEQFLHPNQAGGGGGLALDSGLWCHFKWCWRSFQSKIFSRALQRPKWLGSIIAA